MKSNERRTSNIYWFATHALCGAAWWLFSPTTVGAQDPLRVDFTRFSLEGREHSHPLQEGWESFAGAIDCMRSWGCEDSGDPSEFRIFRYRSTGVFERSYPSDQLARPGESVVVGMSTVGRDGKTEGVNWRDFSVTHDGFATGKFEPFNDLLSDGVMCDECTMTLSLDNLRDGTYELTSYFFTTKFGEAEHREFDPFEIRYTDAKVTDHLVTSEKFMSDNSSDEISTETIVFTVENGSSVDVVFEKFEPDGVRAAPSPDLDYLMFNGFELSALQSAPLIGDFNTDGLVDIVDMNLMSTVIRTLVQFDDDQTDVVDTDALARLLDEVFSVSVGDADFDGDFDADDMITAFNSGQYEDAVDANSTWVSGDWNFDGEFDADDLIFALSDSAFEQPAAATSVAVPEPSSLSLVGLGAILIQLRRQRYRVDSATESTALPSRQRYRRIG